MTDQAPPAGLSIGEASRVTGLPVETLRYYDRARLLGDLPRSFGGQRLFDDTALGLLDVVIRLRRTGMPVEEVRRFSDLVRRGDAHRATRLELLRTHRERVSGQIEQLIRDREVIDWKIAAYTAAESGGPVPPRPEHWPEPKTDLPSSGNPA